LLFLGAHLSCNNADTPGPDPATMRGTDAAPDTDRSEAIPEGGTDSPAARDGSSDAQSTVIEASDDHSTDLGDEEAVGDASTDWKDANFKVVDWGSSLESCFPPCLAKIYADCPIPSPTTSYVEHACVSAGTGSGVHTTYVNGVVIDVTDVGTSDFKATVYKPDGSVCYRMDYQPSPAADRVLGPDSELISTLVLSPAGTLSASCDGAAVQVPTTPVDCLDIALTPVLGGWFCDDVPEAGTDAAPEDTCPPTTQACTTADKVCQYGSGEGDVTCTCGTRGSTKLTWLCTIKPAPPPPTLDAAADATLTAPDGGFRYDCFDCLRADRCAQMFDSGPTVYASSCLADNPSFVVDQWIPMCQQFITSNHCP
jgi:hypothetical protein